MGKYIAGKEPGWVLEDLERFFTSDWYSQLTDVNGEWLMKQIKVNELNKVIEVYKEALSVEREPIFKIMLAKTKSKEGINFSVPPILREGFEKVVRSQLERLSEEKEGLLS